MLLFLMAIACNSASLLPVAAIARILQADTGLLIVAMAALGLTTQFSALRQASIKPLLVGALLFLWLISGGAMINHTVMLLLG